MNGGDFITIFVQDSPSNESFDMKMNATLDQIDRRILTLVQQDAGLSQRDLAERIGLSQNALWRRLKRLEEAGLILGTRAVVNRRALGADLTVFMMIKTRNHSAAWSDAFRRHVEAIPEVTEFHRIGGEWDYLIRIVTGGMAGYDGVYQRLIARFELEAVTGYFSMETIFEGRPIVLRHD
jgi:Lrp/AsnC family transcriptional regulator